MDIILKHSIVPIELNNEEIKEYKYDIDVSKTIPLLDNLEDIEYILLNCHINYTVFEYLLKKDLIRKEFYIENLDKFEYLHSRYSIYAKNEDDFILGIITTLNSKLSKDIKLRDIYDLFRREYSFFLTEKSFVFIKEIISKTQFYYNNEYKCGIPHYELNNILGYFNIEYNVMVDFLVENKILIDNNEYNDVLYSCLCEFIKNINFDKRWFYDHFQIFWRELIIFKKLNTEQLHYIVSNIRDKNGLISMLEEKTLHRKFNLFHENGEWFNLEQKDIDEFINNCQKLENDFKYLSKNNS